MWNDRSSRREVLRGLAAAAAGIVALPDVVSAFERASATNASLNQPYKQSLNDVVQGTLRESARPAIGLQLYTVRTLMSRDVSGTLAAISAAGVREVEFAGYHNLAPDALRAMLSQHGLTAPAAHVPIPSVRDGWTPVLDAAETLGHRWLVIPWVGNDVRGSLDGWRRLAAQLNAAGELARARGMRMAYHNHDFEFATIEGRIAYDVFVESLDPTLVDLELDLYWAVKSGQDVAAMLRARPGRFPLWHLKDAGPAPERAMLDVGAGTINFAALFEMANGPKHAFIEHDSPANPLATVQAGAAWLARLPGN